MRCDSKDSMLDINFSHHSTPFHRFVSHPFVNSVKDTILEPVGRIGLLSVSLVHGLSKSRVKAHPHITGLFRALAMHAIWYTTFHWYNLSISNNVVSCVKENNVHSSSWLDLFFPFFWGHCRLDLSQVSMAAEPGNYLLLLLLSAFGQKRTVSLRQDKGSQPHYNELQPLVWWDQKLDLYWCQGGLWLCLAHHVLGGISRYFPHTGQEVRRNADCTVQWKLMLADGNWNFRTWICAGLFLNLKCQVTHLQELVPQFCNYINSVTDDESKKLWGWLFLFDV